MTRVDQWIAALAFLVVAAGIGASLLVFARLVRVRARTPSPIKARPYECGEEPAGMAWMQFHARYYLVALFFVLFDVEAVFLFPWTMVLRTMGTEALVGATTFVAVLMLGWLYGVRKEAFKWQ